MSADRKSSATKEEENIKTTTWAGQAGAGIVHVFLFITTTEGVNIFELVPIMEIVL